VNHNNGQDDGKDEGTTKTALRQTNRDDKSQDRRLYGKKQTEMSTMWHLNETKNDGKTNGK